MRFQLRRDPSDVGLLMAEMAAHVHACMEFYAQALSPDPVARRAALGALRARDFQAQNTANAVLSGLAASFVTPFDRGDVFRITDDLRVAAARVEAAGDCLDLLAGPDLPSALPAMVHLMVRTTELLTTIVPRLPEPGSLAPTLIEVTMVCKQAAQVHRRLIAEVTLGLDPAMMARQLELAESLRRVVDAVEAVARSIQTVVVQES